MIRVDKDFWQEVFLTVKQQKWRSIMTMFGVFWGLLILVVMVGCGFGMGNGVLGKLTQLSNNSLYLFPQATTMPYNGLSRDRTWKFKESDLAALQQKFGQKLLYITSINIDDLQQVVYDDNMGLYTVGGISPKFYENIPQKVIYGRYINEIDIMERRKVCLVGQKLVGELFDGVDPCGQHISVAGLDYTIVGVTKQTNNQIEVGLNATQSVMLPISTEQIAFNRAGEIDFIVVTLDNRCYIDDYMEDIMSVVKERHLIHPDDNGAIEKLSMRDAVVGYQGLMRGVKMLIWIVGIGTLLAGLIGISNIMLVTVKERTREIGVRRALGAKPKVIIKQIIAESLVLTGVAGICGIVAGVWILVALNHIMSAGDRDLALIVNPMIPVSAAMAALFVLVIGGLLAGYVPARRAMKIKAIEALREE